MTNQRVLFIINGLGLGNSTRCAALIEELLTLGYEIDVMTSGNGLLYFSNFTGISEIHILEAFRYGSTSGNLSAFKTFLLLPQFILTFLKNRRKLLNVIKRHRYSAIIFDSDYTTLGLPKKNRPLLIAINNAAYIVQEFRKIKSVPANIRLQFWIEKIDCWFHKIVPDLVICPTFSEFKNSQKNLIQVSPFIRMDLKTKVKNRVSKNILVMLSGSQFGSSTSFLEKLPKLSSVKIDVVGKIGNSTDTIRYHGKVLANRDLINAADMVVINAGFSAVSEAVILKIPAVVIPIANHAEQYINAKLFKDHGFGILADQENADVKIIELLTELDKFQNAFSIKPLNNGCHHVAQIIDQSIRSRNAFL